MEEKEFLVKEWLQHCGNSLTLTGEKEKRNKNWYYEYNFKNTNTKGWATKSNILKGEVFDRNFISKEEQDFLKKEWRQNCGNVLVLTGRKEKRNKNYYYEYIFKKTNFKSYATKTNILEGRVLDRNLIPKEEERFLKEKYKQNCGNILALTGRREKREKYWYYEYIFKNTNIKGWAKKGDILRGEVLDKKFISKEEQDFLDKEWEQNCGSSLILTGKKKKGGKDYYYEYIFKETNSKGWAKKGNILRGSVLDPLSHYCYNNEENSFRCCIEKAFPQLKISKFNGKKEDNYYEIDIYIPSLRIGFEYNGSYWHNKYEQEKPGYHEEKFKHFQSKGILIFNIWDYFWFEDKKHTRIREKVKQFILNILKEFSIKKLESNKI